MKIIVAGYPKTGTKSMNQALALLGYNSYDFLEHWWYHGREWSKILNHGATSSDFQQMYKDVDVVLDLPAFFFWKEIHDAFPDSKIILTTRDEDSWYRSNIKQNEANRKTGTMNFFKFVAVATLYNPFTISRFYHYITDAMRVILGTTIYADDNELVQRMLFRRHYAYTIQAAPKDKLLVYNVKEGWGPLCEFLAKEIPDVPFPHKNKQASASEEIMAENPIAIKNLQIMKRRIYIACGIAAVSFSVFLSNYISFT